MFFRRLFCNSAFFCLLLVVLLIFIPVAVGVSGEGVSVWRVSVPLNENNSGFPVTVVNSESNVLSSELPENSGGLKVKTFTTPIGETFHSPKPLDLLPEPVLGKESAEFEIIAFHDFSDQFSRKFFNSTYKELLEKYGGKIRIVFRNFPLQGTNPGSWALALAGECANEQEKFWEIHDKLFETTDFSNKALNEIAKSAGLDEKKFGKCISEKNFFPEIQSDFDAARKIGADGVPTFFVNGKKISGAVLLEKFEEIINPVQVAKETTEKKYLEPLPMPGPTTMTVSDIPPEIKNRTLVDPNSKKFFNAEIEIGNKKLVITKPVESQRIVLTAGSISASTSKKVEVSESGIISVEGKEVMVLPDKAVQSVEKNVEVKNMELSVFGEKPVYMVEGERNTRLFGVFPVKIQEKTFVNAQSGAVEKTERPWWNILVFGG